MLMYAQITDYNIRRIHRLAYVWSGCGGRYEQRVVLMFNEECHSCPTGRKLEPQWDSKLDSRERAIQVAFFDLYEDVSTIFQFLFEYH